MEVPAFIKEAQLHVKRTMGEKLYEKTNKEWYEITVKDDPKGVICSFCGKPNDCWDDCGWYYFPTPGCLQCWLGERGNEWRKKYGVGER